MSNAKKESKEVVVKEENLPAEFMYDDIGAGFEGTDSDSYSIPFLQVLQKMSPICDEDSPEYVDGAKSGMLYNTVSGKLYNAKEGLNIIPCAFKRNILVWGARGTDDNGLKEVLSVAEFDAIKKDETKCVSVGQKFYVPNKDGEVDEKAARQYIDTRSHFVLVQDPEDGTWSTAILALSSTQITPSRRLMTALEQKKVVTPQGPRTPPTFANIVKVTTVGKSNARGSWALVQFELVDLVKDKDVYDTAKNFYKSIVEGSVNVDYSKSGGGAGGGAESGEDIKEDENF